MRAAGYGQVHDLQNSSISSPTSENSLVVQQSADTLPNTSPSRIYILNTALNNSLDRDLPPSTLATCPLGACTLHTGEATVTMNLQRIRNRPWANSAGADSPLSIPSRRGSTAANLESDRSSIEGGDNESVSRIRSELTRTVSLDSAFSNVTGSKWRTTKSPFSAETIAETRVPSYSAQMHGNRDVQPRIPRRYSTNSVRSGPNVMSSNSIVGTAPASHESIDSSFDAAYDTEDMEVHSVVSGITNPTAFDLDHLDLDGNETDSIVPPHVPQSETPSLDVPSLIVEDEKQVENDKEHCNSNPPLHQRSRPTALARLAYKFRHGVSVKDHMYHLKRYRNCFVGREAIDFMVESNMATTREDAIFLGQRFMRELNLFHHVHWDHTILKDDYLFYEFTDRDYAANTTHPTRDPATSESAFDSSSSHRSSECWPQDPMSTQFSVSSPLSSSSGEHTTNSLLDVAKIFRQGVTVATHTYRFKKYPDTFIGKEAVDRMLELQLAKSRPEAVFLGERLLEDLNLFHHVKFKHAFKDEHLFYRYIEEGDCSFQDTSDSMFFNSSSSSSGFSFEDSSQSPTSSNASSPPQSPPSIESQAKSKSKPGVTVLQLPTAEGKSNPIHLTTHEESDPRVRPPQLPLRRRTLVEGIGNDSDLIVASEETRDRGSRVAAPQMPVRNVSIASETSSRSRAFKPSETHTSTSGKTSARVTFGIVQARVYERAIDFNPATSVGPSVGLSWSYEDEMPQNLSDVHGQSRNTNFCLSRVMREAILEDLGYSRKEITYAAMQNARAREERKESLNKLSARTMTAHGNANKKVGKIFHMHRKN